MRTCLSLIDFFCPDRNLEYNLFRILCFCDELSTCSVVIVACAKRGAQVLPCLIDEFVDL